MNSYPNQRKITISRNLPKKDAKKPYLCAYTEAIEEASRNLSGEVAFKLYMYLLSNQDKFTMSYSPQHFANCYGVSLDSARRAITALKDAGYIKEIGNNSYIFYEVPQEVKPTIDLIDTVEKRLFKSGGTMVACSFEELYEQFKDRYPYQKIESYWNSAEVASNE